jgi:serine/threonine protein phosphatase PrpC
MTNLSAALEVATATHSGMVRSHNEDSIAADAEAGLAVLADGMGGYNAGEVASGIAVELIKTELKAALEIKKPEELNGQGAEQLIVEKTGRANNAIYEAAQRQPQFSGMGTTLVVAMWPLFVAGTDR